MSYSAQKAGWEGEEGPSKGENHRVTGGQEQMKKKGKREQVRGGKERGARQMLTLERAQI